MAYVLTCLIILLAGAFIRERRKNARRSAQLRRVHAKLDIILAQNTSEKMLLFTEDAELRLLLVHINRVLEHNQRIRAERSGTEKSIRRMLSNASHDLRTPLTVVLGYIETLNLDPDMRRRIAPKCLLRFSARRTRLWT